MMLKKDFKDISPVQRISGSISVSGDKSISHRALIFASLASGDSEIKNFLYAGDCIRTLKIFKALRVNIKQVRDTINSVPMTILVKGKGRYGLKPPLAKLYCGNSGTSMRLIAGVLAGQKFSSVLTGDASLNQRPMRRIVLPLNKMGANITARQGEYPPLKIKGGSSTARGNLTGITYKSPVASAQVKSSLLLAGLYCDNTTTVIEPYKSRDHTERMMKYFEIPLKVSGNSIAVSGGRNWPGKVISIGGDFSGAAFFITAALLISGSKIEIKNVNLNPTRTGFIKIVRRMGGKIKILNKKNISNEPVGDIIISSSSLKAVKVTREDIPSVIDEIPLIALLASQANGVSVIDGAGELRKKETDRLHAIATQLQNMGQSIQEGEDSLVITGRQDSIKGAPVESFGDHRIAMMLTVAALKAKGTTKIFGIKCIDTSFPDFFKILEGIIER